MLAIISMQKFLSFWGIFGTSIAFAVPNTTHLNSGMLLLTDNDLYNDPKPGAGAILLDQYVDWEHSLELCGQLNERLWIPNKEAELELKQSLAHQRYLGAFHDDQKFWIGPRSSTSGSQCVAVDLSGIFQRENCTSTLPVLCTQTAPVSNVTASNSSEVYQIAHQAGNMSFTGWRDFYTWKFYGVRYAVKPARFQRSSVYEGSGFASAIEFPPDCPQQPHDFPGPFDEDCLFLNIVTPYLPSASANNTKRLKPVMLYLHGGGLYSGSSTNRNTDCTNLASRGDVVCIHINYRLASLGFLVLDDGIHNGNYGISDMITALQWVAKNIKAFGGDPARVTIFGQSGGGAAVRALLASPKAKGLFSAAIMQSQPSGISLYGAWANYTSIQVQYETVTKRVLNLTSCVRAPSQIECLQNYDAQALANLGVVDNNTWALDSNAHYPVIDGDILVSDGISALHGGPSYTSDVALMIGDVRDEFAFNLPIPITTNRTKYLNTLVSSLGPSIKPLVQPFLSGIPDTADALFNLTNTLLTDGAFKCLDQTLAYSAVNHKAFASVYRYEFNRTYSLKAAASFCKPPTTQSNPFGDMDQEYYKCHGAEQYYVFGMGGRGLPDYTPDRDGCDILFARLIVDYWSSFARNLNPNPDLEYLKARGFNSTIERIVATGEWQPVTVGKFTSRLLQWDAVQLPYQEAEICSLLGYPVTYYETAN